MPQELGVNTMFLARDDFSQVQSLFQQFRNSRLMCHEEVVQAHDQIWDEYLSYTA
jgi:hypothetical protein